MTLYEFNRTGGPVFSEDSQADYWASEGRCLAQRYENDYRIGLYAIDSFFRGRPCGGGLPGGRRSADAVPYDPVSNELSWLRSFSSVKALDDYLPYIRVG